MVPKGKLRPFEHAQSMLKWPTGLSYVGSFISNLSYLTFPFSRDLIIDLEGSSTLLPLMLPMHIDKLGLFIHLYGTLFFFITANLGSWAGITVLYIKLG